MLEKRLEDKAREYLKSIEMPLSNDYVEYINLKEDCQLPDGTVKSVHKLLYVTVGEGDLTQLNFIFVDAATEKLLFMRTSHANIMIDQ